jgi:hypothetical protein
MVSRCEGFGDFADGRPVWVANFENSGRPICTDDFDSDAREPNGDFLDHSALIRENPHTAA